jgi:hypothetical protein
VTAVMIYDDYNDNYDELFDIEQLATECREIMREHNDVIL